MNKQTVSGRVALLGIFAALTVMLAAVENMLPSLPLPGVRLGLSNVALTAAMVLLGKRNAAAIALVKVVFVFLTRGAAAALLATSGTVLACWITAMLLPLLASTVPFSFVGVSVSSALAHTLGQLLCATWVMSEAVWSMAPLLILCCIPAGTVTGCVLNVLIPRLKLLMDKRLHV